MTERLALEIKTVEEMREKYFLGADFKEVFIPLTSFESHNHISVGTRLELMVMVSSGSNIKIELSGHVSWKRTRDIKMPGKVVPAGIGIKLDDSSVAAVEAAFNDEKSFLSDMDDDSMIGGNYIKIRNDIADKYNKKSERKHEEKGAEKREQPRITINMPVEVFANNQVSNRKTRDISLYGMCIESDEKIKIGEEMVIIFEDDVARKQFMVKAVVVRHVFSREKKDKILGVAVKFKFENMHQKRELMNFIITKS